LPPFFPERKKGGYIFCFHLRWNSPIYFEDEGRERFFVVVKKLLTDLNPKTIAPPFFCSEKRGARGVRKKSNFTALNVRSQEDSAQ
jgi:hypothetical protein